MITPALAEPFIAAGAAVAFIRCFFIVFLRCSWSRRTASAWYFFPIEKGLGPRGYERNEIIHAWWVTPSRGKLGYNEENLFLPVANII